MKIEYTNIIVNGKVIGVGDAVIDDKGMVVLTTIAGRKIVTDIKNCVLRQGSMDDE
ncbi:MAG TPA: hypothetical protein VJB90_05890 [Candidatus Nanoarchaeia archaeon]|nr:hypothetical protein [Candidatus Nanoarchaeia archaeon]